MLSQSNDYLSKFRSKVHRNLNATQLTQAAVAHDEGRIVNDGPLAVTTGKHTGRSAGDKYIVREPATQDFIWWGKVNQPFDAARFDHLRDRMLSFLSDKEVYVQDVHACADSKHRLGVRFITEYAWHSLFVHNLFITDPSEPGDFKPGFTVIASPSFHADPAMDGTKSEAFIIINFAQRLILVGGTQYAGEMKKAIFTVLNTLLPRKGVLSMHCSANIGDNGDTAIFFGLSGTGKTTLSADSKRTLIGDDEHGWDDNGIFNFEGGCYAKIINLSPTAEPEIYNTTRQPGTILENVCIDDAGTVDLDCDALTENTRAAYSIEQIPNATLEGRGGHPSDIIMLTCDAFGVLPPISRLSTSQALYHFLSGYTAKVAGTEKGVTEPSATFSACFGEPFLALHPSVYAELLGQKIAEHNVRVWLVNTGWSGGTYGVGKRISIANTRAMVHAALNGDLDDVPYMTHPVFRLEMPTRCPGVPDSVLDPRSTWADPAAYDQQAARLASMYRENFAHYADLVSDEIRAEDMPVHA
jgi:phosphoenolpyruvate carboxykinase (ATP)